MIVFWQLMSFQIRPPFPYAFFIDEIMLSNNVSTDVSSEPMALLGPFHASCSVLLPPSTL